MNKNYVYPGTITGKKGDYLIEFIDFPNLVASGESIDELIISAQEVLALELLEYESRGEEPPAPTFDRDNVTYVHVWIPYYRNIVKEIYIKKTVTIPQWLDLLAKENNINFSACMVKGIKEELGIE